MNFDNVINELNQQQMEFINSYITSTRSNISIDLHFEWDDKSVLDYIDGKVPELQLHQYDYTKSIDHKIKALVDKINDMVKKYNGKKTTRNIFLKEVKKLNMELMPLIKDSNVYLLKNNQATFVESAKFVVINGVGGIGKSHFLRDCQENISKNAKYKFLFVYGKNFKKTENIPWQQIEEYVKSKEFLLVFDAVNELSKDDRQKLYHNINRLKRFSNFRVVLSYRTHSMLGSKISGVQEETYVNKMASKLINFNGVDYYSAIEQICNYYKFDISRIYNIIETNNPMILNMLIESNAFSNKTFIRKLNKNKNVTLMTHIFEYYIKHHFNKIFKNNNGKKAWEILKQISSKMYNCNRNYFSKKDINLSSTDKDMFVSNLLESGFIQKLYYKPHSYQFSIEQLSNYIIMRTAFQKITNKHDQQIINHIRRKAKNNVSWKEYLLYVIIDALGENVDRTLKIIKASDLNKMLTPDILGNISFKDNNLIQQYQNKFKTTYPFEFFIKLGGLPHRIYNCENYFYNYLTNSNKIKIIKLNYSSQENLIITRLRFNLNCINGNLFQKENLNEIFLFSLSCLYIPNEKIITLASKTIYDIIENIDNTFINIIDNLYKSSDNYFVKSHILKIFLYFSSSNQKIVRHTIESIVKDKNILDFECLKNYSDFQNNDNLFITFAKTNLLKKVYNKQSKNSFNQDEPYKMLFSRIRMFRLIGALRLDDCDQLKSHLELLNISKRRIKKFNDIVSLFFGQISYCKCQIEPNSHDYDFLYSLVSKKLNITEDIVNQNKIFYGFYSYLKQTMNYFEITDKEIQDFKFEIWNSHSFESQYIMYLYKFAENCFAGSLFCNYYIKPKYGFPLYFNNEQNRLVCGYQPVELYSDEKHKKNFSAPIQSNMSNIEKLNKEVEKRLLYLDRNIKDENWSIDECQTIQNISELLKPYTINNEEWLVLFADLDYRIKETEIYNTFSDSIIIGVSCNYKQSILSKLNRYNTIERKFYYKSIRDYVDLNTNDCCGVQQFASDLDITNSTHMYLPPSVLIKELKLHYNPLYSSWDSLDGEQIIWCDNNSCKYYQQIVKSGIYIKKSFFDKILDKLKPFFYVFTERYSKYNLKNRISKHMLFKNDVLVKQVDNSQIKYKVRAKRKCKDCFIYNTHVQHERERAISARKFKITFEKYIKDD